MSFFLQYHGKGAFNYAITQNMTPTELNYQYEKLIEQLESENKQR